MVVNYLTVVPYNKDDRKQFKHVSFGISIKPNSSIGQILKEPLNKTAPLGRLRSLLYAHDIKAFETEAFRRGISTADYFAQMLGVKKFMHKVLPVASVTKKIPNTNLAATSLMDGGQIFSRTLEDLQSAKKSIQVKMFEFQNISVDGDDWKSRGAENVPGFEEQKAILQTLITKKRTNPKMKIQVILDVHKWGMNSDGRKKHYNNQAMIMFLKKNGIDVVPAPRDSILHHDKYLIVDGQKAIIGGMNWGTHSAANHDFCFAFENIDKKKHSEIDNLMHDFNINWKFAWQRIGSKELVPGPLNKEQQKFYSGINKEIKEENVTYYNYIKEFFENPEAKNRYSEGRLDLVSCRPVKNPAIKFIDTKPRELSAIGEKGSESAYEYLMNEVNNCKEIFGELFYFTNKEIKETIIARVKEGKLKAKFNIHEADFPYCKDAFTDLVENGVDVRIYKEDKTITQRMHAKWVVFDNKRVMVGSPNISDRALMQNLDTGFRNDTPLTVQKLETRIKEFVDEVKPYEDVLQLPHFQWDGSKKAYKKLINLRKSLRTAHNHLKNDGEARMKLNGKKYLFKKDENAVYINGVRHPFKEKDGKGTEAILVKIRGLLGNIFDRHNAKPKHKRGNNESAVVIDSLAFVKEVFRPQFDRDMEHSISAYTEQHKIKPKYIAPKRLNVEG